MISKIINQVTQIKSLVCSCGSCLLGSGFECLGNYNVKNIERFTCLIYSFKDLANFRNLNAFNFYKGNTIIVQNTLNFCEYSGLKWASNSEAKWASDWGLIVSKRDTERFTKQT